MLQAACLCSLTLLSLLPVVLFSTLLLFPAKQLSQLQKFLEGSRFEQRRSMLEFDEVYEVGGTV